MTGKKHTAIVLAGGKAKPAFVAATGVAIRALAEVAPGRTMLSIILDTLSEAETVAEVYVIGEVGIVMEAQVTEPGESLLDNITRGIEASGAGSDEKVLLVSADIPFIKPQDVDTYTRAALQSGGDFCYPIIPMENCRRDFPGMKRTTLKLREGEFTGGNIMLVRAGVITGNSATIHAAYAARKSPLALGKMLGWGLFGKIIASQIAAPHILDIPMLEAAVGKLLGDGISAKAVVTEAASIGTDIDKPEDIEIAKRIFAGQSKAS